MSKRIILLIFLSVVSAEIILYMLAWYFSSASVEHFRNIIYVVGGTTAAFIAAWRAWVADKQTEINAQGQVTDRFTHAIKQLGDENIYIQLGAIHALERIGRDSRDDTLAVLRLLASFIRNKSPEIPRLERISKQSDEELLRDTPSSEVTESMLAIARLSARYSYLLREEQGISINLSRIRLTPHLMITEGCFLRFDFGFSDFTRGIFLSSDFEKSYFTGAKLAYAQFAYCKLVHAVFTGANLDAAKFEDVDMDGALFESATCNATDFSKAKNLTAEMLRRIIYNQGTPPKLPPYLSINDLPHPKQEPSENSK